MGVGLKGRRLPRNNKMSILERLLDKIEEENQPTKICTNPNCEHKGKPQPATDEYFPQRHGRPIGQLNSWCKDCLSKYRKEYGLKDQYDSKRTKEYYYDNIDKSLTDALWRRMRNRYKLTKADFDAMLVEQNGRCAICGQPLTESLHVDHCHKTGKIRGLVCHKCNNLIMYIEQVNNMNKDLKNEIEDYLDKYKEGG